MIAAHRLTRVLALLVCAPLAALAGCAGDETPSRGGGVTESPADGTSGDPVRFTVALDTTSVRLGDPLPFRVTLTNGGDTPVSVNVPRIGRQSLSFRVAKGSRIRVIERLHAELDERTGGLRWLPNDVRTLEPGASLEETVTTRALEVGDFTFTAQYERQGADPATAAPIQVKVEPAEGDLGRLGARIRTSLGDLTVRLRPDLAYNTVESFVSLVHAGFYDGLAFHRVVKEFMAQGGCPLGTGLGGPGYYLPLEAHTHLLHDRGVLSMARTGHPNTAGSQFFLMFRRNPGLDPGFRGQPGYTTFGQLVDGDGTLEEIEKLGAPPTAPPGAQQPTGTITIEKMEIVLLPSK